MFFSKARKELDNAKYEAEKLFHSEATKPKILSIENFRIFCANIIYSFRLIWEEREILFFAALQWMVITIAYLIWVQVLDWIPDEVWEAAKESRSDSDFALINLLLLGWSALVIIAAAYPLSILNIAIANVHLLRYSGQNYTITQCFAHAFHNLGKVWTYTAIDAYLTCSAILDRLPKKNNRRNAYDELLYYAWKIGTMGAAISLMYGKGFIDAGKDSITLLKERPLQAIGLRMGYSLVCWIVGISAYILSLFYYAHFGGSSGTNEIYHFYLTMAFPIVVAAGVVSILVRPLYLIALANLYTQTIPTNTLSPDEKVEKLPLTSLIIFALLLGGIAGAILANDTLGLQEWINQLAASDLEAYHKNSTH